ncbi:hypothetical protein [Actinoplanes utahensis]|uniref:Uncharacterized protein n=1 Tax=Actinoplanes utahensis TaxID=1869 RepID=A0A0A6UDL2_ACTUT|nr:hypothetical protein [Actinoplanes utahensis]KHD73581.1 hypothetical protein MB27_34240 [Actinoplanes utahensis]GIF33937.1 hypothetical protein Aut01nite_69230 [Actinoplanes utahensis]
MSTTASEEPLRLHRHRRWAFDQLLVESALIPPVFVVVTVFSRPGPVEYQWFVELSTPAAVIWAVLVLPLFVYRLTLGRRKHMEISSTDSPRPGAVVHEILWPYVKGIQVAWGLTGRRVRVSERASRGPVTLYAPRAGWLPDRRFDREVSELRQRAIEHGATVQPARSRRWGLAVGLTLVAVVLATGVRTAVVGAVWPWTPIASRVGEGCPALDAAGLERYWPASSRQLDKDQDVDFGTLQHSSCIWVRDFSPDGVGPFEAIRLTVRLHEPKAERSAVAAATHEFDEHQRASDYPYVRVPGFGDEAFFISTPARVLLGARKANVNVFVSVWPGKLDGDGDAAVQGLAAEILDDIELDSTEAAEREPA